MKCLTTREGSECSFMSKKGCSYKNGTCYEAVKSCKGCNRLVKFSSKNYCTASPEPDLKWKNGNCNLATHLSLVKNKNFIKINPLKASKRSVR